MHRVERRYIMYLLPWIVLDPNIHCGEDVLTRGNWDWLDGGKTPCQGAMARRGTRQSN